MRIYGIRAELMLLARLPITCSVRTLHVFVANASWPCPENPEVVMVSTKEANGQIEAGPQSKAN